MKAVDVITILETIQEKVKNLPKNEKSRDGCVLISTRDRSFSFVPSNDTHRASIITGTDILFMKNTTGLHFIDCNAIYHIEF